MTWRDTIPLAALPVLVPLVTALLLLVVRVRAVGVWIGVAGAAAALAAGGALAWWHPDDLLGVFAAPLVAAVGLAIALAMPAWIAREIEGFRLAAAHVPRALATGQALLAGAMLAVLAPDPAVGWLGLVAVSLALLLPLAVAAEPAVRRRGRALLGVAGIGLVVALAGAVALLLAGAGDGWRLPAARPDAALAWLGAACLLLGGAVIGAVAMLAGREDATPGGGLSGFAVVLALLVLALRLPAALFPAPGLLAWLGVAVVLAGAVLAARAGAIRDWVGAATLAQCGLVLLAAGVGTSAAMFAALIQLGLLVLARVAVVPDALGMLALAGMPPFGVFAGVYLVLSAVAATSVPLVVAVGAGLLVPAWRLARLLPPVAWTGWHGVAAWALLALGAGLGLAMPAPLAGWIARVAAYLP